MRGVDAILRGLDSAAAANTADRAIVCNTLSRLAHGIAASVAELQEHLYPPRRFGHRNARLATVEAAMYHAADLIEVTAENLHDCAALTARAITAGDTVDYHGSLGAHRGVYRLNGPCTCDNCLDTDVPSLELGAITTGHPLLICVSPEHITALPAHVDPTLAGRATVAATRMLATFQALPAPVPAVDALPLASRLHMLTGRLATAAEGFTKATHAARQTWMVDVTFHAYLTGWTRRHQHPRHQIHDMLTQVPTTLGDARTRMQRAVTVLADLADQPRSDRAAA
ncbi:hypothetical protein O7626_29510 [Micromonospora sp. WMMD1102]|uniref:hypothetical protein n=1 Tax=Micromonospora sp. WMMD1102 TaxID=3016105 RepID=UPI0024155C1B|nr:hypothetical protein [Micromonospora sp. WMMD1102]MDG4790012.1 hypothetical protein [Micromonospora sp. WMMD1102]